MRTTDQLKPMNVARWARICLLAGMAVSALPGFMATLFAVEQLPVQIHGTVSYQADPARPWRYSRYYVGRGPQAPLSECLVALRGRNLKGLQPRPAPAMVHVDQQDYRFVPETVAIRLGDAVRFTNSDAALHNVRTEDGAEGLNVSLLQDGEYLHTFRQAGNERRPYRIGCAFHSQMQTWIYVFDHPFFVVTKEDGQFSFSGIPAGDYTLEIRHPAGQLEYTQPVTVSSDASQTVEIRLSPDHLVKK